MEDIPDGDRWLTPAVGLDRLVSRLVEAFDEVVAPVALDGAIRLLPISSADEMTVGVTDEQETAEYRLVPSGTRLRFSHAVGPDSLKAIVHPSRSAIWTMRRADGSIVVEPSLHGTTTRAVIGARACDLRALEVLERTQTLGPHADPAFTSNRAGLFLVAVDCTHPAATCFCTTAGTGPAADRGYDIALTELDGPAGATYLVRAGSDRGRGFVDDLFLGEAPAAAVRQAEVSLRRAASDMIRELPDGAPDAVRDSVHARWDDVAERCLACGNCTAVCPTCFCTDMDDRVDLDGVTATRTRVWDSCFSLEYSHLGPAPHRMSTKARYRQWLSHKIGTWHDQFGESGCVGCGRCITWCPVGIDLTAELEALASPLGSRT